MIFALFLPLPPPHSRRLRGERTDVKDTKKKEGPLHQGRTPCGRPCISNSTVARRLSWLSWVSQSVSRRDLATLRNTATSHTKRGTAATSPVVDARLNIGRTLGCGDAEKVRAHHRDICSRPCPGELHVVWANRRRDKQEILHVIVCITASLLQHVVKLHHELQPHVTSKQLVGNVHQCFTSACPSVDHWAHLCHEHLLRVSTRDLRTETLQHTVTRIQQHVPRAHNRKTRSPETRLNEDDITRAHPASLVKHMRVFPQGRAS